MEKWEKVCAFISIASEPPEVCTNNRMTLWWFFSTHWDCELVLDLELRILTTGMDSAWMGVITRSHTICSSAVNWSRTSFHFTWKRSNSVVLCLEEKKQSKEVNDMFLYFNLFWFSGLQNLQFYFLLEF